MEKREKRERSMGRGDTRVSDSEGVRREKVRNLTMREGRHQKIMFIMATNKDNIYRRCNVWERLFSKFFFFVKQLIENKPYFDQGFPLTKDSFPLTSFFCATKHWKMWKTIFIEGFIAKQTERK